ncbi:MAG: hypothetical protein E7653_00870 [Ruminococcaceae bacterium]|nr:hypothetical protein [Oscillospiraceae bacterium]
MKYTKSSDEIKLEKIKILFQFAIMLIASIVLGVCLARVISIDLRSTATANILRHFSPQGTKGVGDFLEYLRYSAFDVIVVVLLVIFSFSFINYIISDIVIVMYGAKLGIASSLLLAIPEVRAFDRFVFFTFKPLLLILIVLFSYKMALFSLEIRRFSNNGRLVADRRKTLSMLLASLAFIGLILIINGLYCLCLYI